MKVKRIFICVVALLLFCGIGLRIYVVNAYATSIQVVHHKMGEWVDLDGAFINKIDENTYGYSIKVNDAKLMSYNEYIKQCGRDENHTVEDRDEKSVVCLQVETKNEGNAEGAIFIFDCKLIPSRMNTYYIYDGDLWAEREPAMLGSFFLGLRENSEYTTFIPYTINANEDSKYERPITDTSFELIVSNSPIRHVIDITL